MQEMSIFMVTFHRYDPRSGEGRKMTTHFAATNFMDAARIADLMCLAMGDADPSCVFKTASVTNDGLRGTITASGWMTDDELCAKIAAEKAGKK